MWNCQGTLWDPLCCPDLWHHLTRKLLEWGFEINPYDWYITYKMIKGSQCTITWHGDDLKLSHISPDILKELTEFHPR